MHRAAIVSRSQFQEYQESHMTSAPLRVGNVEIIPLLDAAFPAPPVSALFPSIPPEAWVPYKEHLEGDGRTMPLPVSCFLVRSNGKTVLVDSGIGAKSRPGMPNGRLPDALAQAGVSFDEIDIVLATHIHVDHVGWHTTLRDGALVPTFPRARHVFNRAEWDYWTQPDVAKATAYVVDCVLPLQGAATVDLVDGEHKLTDEITLLPTPGHTPAHTSVAIMSAGEAAVIIGDVCHHPAQVSEGWSPVFDMNPALSAESREKLLQRIEADRMTVIAGHFAHPGFGRVVRVEGKRYWRAL
jgi:glyoxylase-like metal-dependent hydrolase (beta-lactamase superfamily II)